MWGPDMNIIIDPGTGDTSVNTYPYYQNWSGTSFSAPITAGVAALIKSINPCLTPEDVQTILKTTTDPIIDANLYPGKVGTGRLNAYKAVKLAYDSYSFKNYTISSGQNITWNDSKFIDTLYIAPGGELTINDDCFFNYRGIVQVDTNAKLTINDAF
jgi:subtilisin family serine protease